ncbi:MAG: hypothetical protein ACKV22_23485, partial [Bryobacteraceae bacterium]
YGTLADGNLVTPPIPSLAGPFARMGRGVADGRGNFFAQTVDSFNGLVTRADFAGNYVVGSDCSITLNLLVPIPGIPGLIPFTFVGALADNGREATVMVASPPGAVVRVHLRQQRRGRCSKRDLNKSFRLSLGGSIVSQPPSPSGFFTRVGLIEFDGDGKFSANTAVSYNGLITTESFSGTYAVDAACFVTLRYTLGQQYVWSGFLTDNGDAVNLLVTAPQGAVVTGTLKEE